jgi:hypothetical protein
LTTRMFSNAPTITIRFTYLILLFAC